MLDDVAAGNIAREVIEDKDRDDAFVHKALQVFPARPTFVPVAGKPNGLRIHRGSIVPSPAVEEPSLPSVAIEVEPQAIPDPNEHSGQELSEASAEGASPGHETWPRKLLVALLEIALLGDEDGTVRNLWTAADEDDQHEAGETTGQAGHEFSHNRVI
jgi:hypothetical protein